MPNPNSPPAPTGHKRSPANHQPAEPPRAVRPPHDRAAASNIAQSGTQVVRSPTAGHTRPPLGTGTARITERSTLAARPRLARSTDPGTDPHDGEPPPPPDKAPLGEVTVRSQREAGRDFAPTGPWAAAQPHPAWQMPTLRQKSWTSGPGRGDCPRRGATTAVRNSRCARSADPASRGIHTSPSRTTHKPCHRTNDSKRQVNSQIKSDPLARARSCASRTFARCSGSSFPDWRTAISA